MTWLFDLYVDESLRVDVFSVNGPWHVLVSGHLGVVDLQVGRASLEDLLLGVELGVRVANVALHFDHITRLAAFRSAQDFNLNLRFFLFPERGEKRN